VLSFTRSEHHQVEVTQENTNKQSKCKYKYEKTYQNRKEPNQWKQYKNNLVTGKTRRKPKMFLTGVFENQTSLCRVTTKASIRLRTPVVDYSLYGLLFTL